MALTPLGLYFCGKSLLQDAVLSPESPIDQRIVTIYWKWLGGEGEPRLARLNPYNYFFKAFSYTEARRLGAKPDPAHTLVANSWSYLAREVTSSQGRRNQHIVGATSAIYLSRNWTPEQAIGTALNKAYFGRDNYGISAAADTYFGMAYDELNESELYLLFNLQHAPSRYGLWCNLEKNIEANSRRLKERGVREPNMTIRLLEAPKNSCT